MRRIIETGLILLLCLVPLGSFEAAAIQVPIILCAVVLSYLALFGMVPFLEYCLAGAFLVLWWFFPQTALFAPLLAYALLQKKRALAAVPVLSALLPARPVTLLISLVALWLSYQEMDARGQEKAYFSMRDDFVQNEILQHQILREQELNHEKNLEIAVLRERNRISREIHDSVGHTISAALLQIEALKVSAPEPVTERLGTLSEALAGGMEEVRQSLHNLHNESIALAPEISRLTASLEDRYKITKTVQVGEDVPMNIKRAMISLLREALTNIRRHSDASEIQIVLRELPQHYTITVKDNGSLKPVKSGIGLASMEEMSRVLGGVFSHGWSDGFFVHMAVPKDPGTTTAEQTDLS